MPSLNRVLLMGHLTRDPDLKFAKEGMAVASFGLAINQKWKDKESVTFVDCTAWGKTAETIHKHLTKGSPIFIEGRLTFRQWDGPDGKKRSKLDVTVERFEFIGKGDGKPAGEKPQASRNPDTPPPGPDDFDDDTIPF